MNQPLKLGFQDFLSAITAHRISAVYLGWFDITQRYRRSKLGPFWLTISTGVTAIGMGLIFGAIFNMPLREFLPFLCCGLIFWNFIVLALNESITIYSDSSQTIKNINMSFTSHLLRMAFRNIIILAHNAMILIIVFLYFLIMPSWEIVFLFPGLMIFLVNIGWVALVISIVCARYPDLGQIIANILQLSFFVTPIIWTPDMMIDRGRKVFLDINPFYHLITVIRAPILGELPDAKSWVVLVLTAIIGWLAALYLLGRYRKKIVYWV